MKNKMFEYLSKIFKENGFSIFAVGGTVRDELLGLEVFDFDFTTDATPEEMMKFLPNADPVFAKYGCIKYKGQGFKADITTFRTEKNYEDFRHPADITFVKTIEEDYKRRDFTINAIYKDYEGNIFDPAHGLEDLNNKVIRFIGDPETRIKEDPLRILRAKRFEKFLGFKIEEKSLKAMEKLSYLLEKLNPEKVRAEAKKTR